MWEDLSFKDRSKLIELGVSQGILDLSTIKHLYNINADGGSMDEPEGTVTENRKAVESAKNKYPMLTNLDFSVYSDSNYRASDYDGYGDIEVFHKGEQRIDYTPEYSYPNPNINQDNVLYNPDRIPERYTQDAINLDAISHLGHNDPTYDALNATIGNEYPDAATSEMLPLYEKMTGKNLMKMPDSKRPTKNKWIPQVLEAWDDAPRRYQNAIDGLVRDYIISKEHPNPNDPIYKGLNYVKYNPQWDSKNNAPFYLNQLYDYITTGRRPANILPEVIVTGKRIHRRADGGRLYDDGGKKDNDVIYGEPMKPVGKMKVVSVADPSKGEIAIHPDDVKVASAPLTTDNYDWNYLNQYIDDTPTEEDINDTMDKRISDYLTTSNDATAVGNPSNSHLTDRGIYGAMAHAEWEKQHPTLTEWSYLPTIAALTAVAAPFAVGAGDAIAATSVGRGIYTGLSTIANAAKSSTLLPWADALGTSLSISDGIRKIRNDDFSPEAVLEVSPLLRGVPRTIGIANNLKPQSIRNWAYVSKAPIGYNSKKEALGRLIDGIASGKPADIDNPWWFNMQQAKELDEYAVYPESLSPIERESYLQNFRENALKARADMWRMYNHIPQKYNTFVPSKLYPGAWTSDKAIKDIKYLSPQIKGRNQTDFVTTVGGNIGIPDVERLGWSDSFDGTHREYGVTITDDLFDLHPFSREGDRIINKYVKPVFERIVSKPIQKISGKTIKTPEFDFLKPLEDKIANYEIGRLIGSNPVLVKYDIPWTEETKFMIDKEGDLPIKRQYVPGFVSDKILPENVINWKQYHKLPDLNSNQTIIDNISNHINTGGLLESDEDNLLAPIIKYYEDTSPSLSTEDQNTFAKGGQMKRARQAVDYFVNKGLTREQAAGLVGNLMRESNMRSDVINPASGAYGIGQWLGSRKTRLFRRYGYHPTFEQQLDYIWDELNTSHRRGLQMLRASKTVNDAARNAFGYYEFSAGPEAAIRAMNSSGKNTKWKNPNGTIAMNRGINNARQIFGLSPMAMDNIGSNVSNSIGSNAVLNKPENVPNIQPIISDDYAPVTLANLKELPTFGQEEDNDSSIPSFGPQYLAQNLNRLGMPNPLNPFEKGYQLQSPKAIYANMQPTSNDTFLDSSWFKKGGYLYGDGGKLANTDPSSSEYQDLLLFRNPLVKLFDPTGISSWKDVKESYGKEGLSANTLWQAAGAIPLIGKLKSLGRAINIGQFIGDVAEDYKKIYDISRRSGNTLLVSPNGEFKLRNDAPYDAERIGGWKPASAEQVKQYNQRLVNDTEFGYGEYDPADPPLGLITDYAKKYGKAEAKKHFALDSK